MAELTNAYVLEPGESAREAVRERISPSFWTSKGFHGASVNSEARSAAAVTRIPRRPFVAHSSQNAQCRTRLLLIRWRPHRFVGTDHRPHSGSVSGTPSGGFAEQVMTFASDTNLRDGLSDCAVCKHAQRLHRDACPSGNSSLRRRRRSTSHDRAIYGCAWIEPGPLPVCLRLQHLPSRSIASGHAITTPTASRRASGPRTVHAHPPRMPWSAAIGNDVRSSVTAGTPVASVPCRRLELSLTNRPSTRRQPTRTSPMPYGSTASEPTEPTHV